MGIEFIFIGDYSTWKKVNHVLEKYRQDSMSYIDEGSLTFTVIKAVIKKAEDMGAVSRYKGVIICKKPEDEDKIFQEIKKIIRKEICSGNLQCKLYGKRRHNQILLRKWSDIEGDMLF